MSVKLCANTYSQLLRRFVPAPNPFGIFVKRESSVISFIFSAARSAMFEHNLMRCQTENQSFQLKKSTTDFKIN